MKVELVNINLKIYLYQAEPLRCSTNKKADHILKTLGGFLLSTRRVTKLRNGCNVSCKRFSIYSYLEIITIIWISYSNIF